MSDKEKEKDGDRDRAYPGILLALVCLYVPYAWLLLIGEPWNEYRWHWLTMWPLLPGLLVHAIPAIHQQPDRLGYLVMGLVTSLIIALIVMSSRLSWRVAIIVSIVVGLLSSANAWIAYQLFLS